MFFPWDFIDVVVINSFNLSEKKASQKVFS